MTVRPTALDRAAQLRDEPGILARLRASPETRVVVVRDGRVRVEAARLTLVAPGAVGAAEWALLGRLGDGSPVLVAAVPDPAVPAPAVPAPAAPAGQETAVDAVPAEQESAVDAVPEPAADAGSAETWLGLRDLGGLLDEASMELVIAAFALADWLRHGAFCPACGGRTELRQAGWSRLCQACGREHFPRTDPAVIVAVESEDGERLLLGANARWRGRMYSCFAGFVEAGESLEATVHREIEEEAGVRLRDVRYIASQPWPYPRSLMVGFRATAVDAGDARADGEEIIDVRWFTRGEIRAALAGDGPVGLPGPASIARRLIREWCEERA